MDLLAKCLDYTEILYHSAKVTETILTAGRTLDIILKVKKMRLRKMKHLSHSHSVKTRQRKI